MNLRIAYYVVALAISLAAFAGAYGYADAYALTARTADDEAASHPGVVWARDIFGILSTDASAEAVAERANIARLLIAEDNRINAAALSAVGAARAAAAAANAAVAAARVAYIMAAAVSLAAFAGAYIIDKRRTPPKG